MFRRPQDGVVPSDSARPCKSPGARPSSTVRPASSAEHLAPHLAHDLQRHRPRRGEIEPQVLPRLQRFTTTAPLPPSSAPADAPRPCLPPPRPPARCPCSPPPSGRRPPGPSSTRHLAAQRHVLLLRRGAAPGPARCPSGAAPAAGSPWARRCVDAVRLEVRRDRAQQRVVPEAAQPEMIRTAPRSGRRLRQRPHPADAARHRRPRHARLAEGLLTMRSTCPSRTQVSASTSRSSAGSVSPRCATRDHLEALRARRLARRGGAAGRCRR